MTDTNLPLDEACRALDATMRRIAGDYSAGSADLIASLRARVAEMEQRERRFYSADGSFVEMESAAAVIAARIEAAKRVAELEALAAALREALVETNALMVRPAHIFSCGAYDKRSIGGVMGECTCGVDQTAKRNEQLLASSSAAHLAAYRKSVIEGVAAQFDNSGEPIGKATAAFIRILAAEGL